jgi:hypothetical protein
MGDGRWEMVDGGWFDGVRLLLDVRCAALEILQARRRECREELPMDLRLFATVDLLKSIAALPRTPRPHSFCMHRPKIFRGGLKYRFT